MNQLSQNLILTALKNVHNGTIKDNAIAFFLIQPDCVEMP
jgi:hypothetical protein